MEVLLELRSQASAALFRWKTWGCSPPERENEMNSTSWSEKAGLTGCDIQTENGPWETEMRGNTSNQRETYSHLTANYTDLLP